MCIALITTAHPSYALIILDNRDEFVLRPTTRPHWWTHPSGTSILSSRDLQRSEKGTWLGITRDGLISVLTNYRETDLQHAQPVHGMRSRGAMVTGWLASGTEESGSDTVRRIVEGGGVKGVGGFSMLCGKLRLKKGERELEPLAIVSNRSETVDQVPWIAGGRGEIAGLSNQWYDDPSPWPKVDKGKQLLREVLASSSGLSEEALLARLFTVLDSDTLPLHAGMSLIDYIFELKHSIFIPPLGDEEHRAAMDAAVAAGGAVWASDDQKAAEEELKQGERPEAQAQNLGFETGMYGTQRQTVILVGWDGEVVFVERALFDNSGREVARGEGDVTVRFTIEGWGGRQGAAGP